ncbi:hypothetical protein [Quatrionicoccus australiensis]|jgi:hypothetical protein|nr:hypothetical protein [Quatrionicoccus australiensis]MCB4361359.1 hypothetical protein [Quatrionicoccus australiensis]
MSKSTSDLCLVMRAGGGVKIDAAKFSTSDLCLIARAGSETGAMLFVTNAVTKSTSDLCLIGRANPGRVVFE